MDLPEDIDIEDFEDDEPGELYQMLGMVILPLCSEMHGQWQTGRDKLVTVMSQVWHVTVTPVILKKCDKVVTMTPLHPSQISM